MDSAKNGGVSNIVVQKNANENAYHQEGELSSKTRS